jgi:hypothetical protein
MNLFLDLKAGGVIPRIHPLLLSLTEAINESETSPNIASISEDDPRILNSPYYTPLREFPPLEIHSPGQNGMSSLSDNR